MNVAVQGSPEGYLAKVNSDGQMETATEVTNTVATKPGAAAAYRTRVTLTTTSSTLLAARTGRRGLWIQNQGANPVYLRFEAAAATNQDWLLAAGGEFRADNFAYEGEVRGATGAGTSAVLGIELG
ncbi:MAG: hypothetical protein HUU06_05915 [Planctomycetaceae bacterium]|nr:hypothetical protein [Planctomycetaceae bacterium]